MTDPTRNAEYVRPVHASRVPCGTPMSPDDLVTSHWPSVTCFACRASFQENQEGGVPFPNWELMYNRKREKCGRLRADVERWERNARDAIALADRLAEVIRSGAAGRSLETDTALKAWAALNNGGEL